MTAVDAEWSTADTLDEATTYRLTARATPYVIRVAGKWVKVEVEAGSSELKSVIDGLITPGVDSAPMRYAATKSPS